MLALEDSIWIIISADNTLKLTLLFLTFDKSILLNIFFLSFFFFLKSAVFNTNLFEINFKPWD